MNLSSLMNLCNGSSKPVSGGLTKFIVSAGVLKKTKRRAHKESAQRNRKTETNNVSLLWKPLRSRRMGTYCKGNSVHSQSLPPLVNHCNIRARGNTLLNPPTASAPNIQSAHETFRVPTYRGPSRTA